MSRSLPLLALALLLGAPGFPPRAVAAQSPDAEWAVEAELGGSFFFGNRDQSHFTTRTEIERADSLFEASTEFRFTYGEAPDSEGRSVVNRRSWMARSSLDFLPEEIWRPFVSGRMESSLERQIALRYDAGAGIKLDIRRDRNNRFEVSLAVLAERTYGRDQDPLFQEELTLARWSSDVRLRRTLFEERVALDSRNVYRPVFDGFGNFTFSSRNSLTFELTEVVALRFSVRTDYDSGAVDRGADTNRDGQLEVAIAARF